jgi:putative FmdB family regulatory protein
MPIYEFECKQCSHSFDLAESVTEHDKHAEKCPKCGSGEIARVISSVSVKTSRKS